MAQTSTRPAELVVDLVIDGAIRPAASGERLEVRDPATGEVVAEVAGGGPDDVQQAIDAGRAAQPAWAGLEPAERGRRLRAVADHIRALADDLALTESTDTGKPLSQARTDVAVAAEYFEFYGGLVDILYGDTVPLRGDDLALVLREPYGVTGHITAWNYPIQIAARTTAPALMAGNACVLKPAEEAPLTTLALGALAVEAGVPAGVLNVVPGIGETAGAYLAASDDIDHLSFTGGLDTGRLVMTAAARNVKPVTLELGGKSPNIVLDDADLDRSVPVITKAILQNAGQTCSAGSRAIVHRSLHAELLERLAAAFEGVRLGRGLDDPDLGPLISAAQVERVLSFLQSARADGGRIVFGGDRATVDGLDGYFVQPTLVDAVHPDARVAQEEVFGPVLSVLVCDSDADAVEIADATPYGLVTAVWTSDIDRALRVARRLKSGQVFVNAFGAGGGVQLPFGGYKHSGFGREKGVEAMRTYTQTKTVTFDVHQ